MVMLKSEFKNNLKDEIINICEDYKGGNIEILEAVLALRRLKTDCEAILKDISSFESEYYNEIELSSKEYNNQFRGARFEFRNGRKTFDFTKIAEIIRANKTLKDLKKKYQVAWEMKQKGIAPVDEETGEILQVPEMKQSKSSMIVKLV